MSSPGLRMTYPKLWPPVQEWVLALSLVFRDSRLGTLITSQAPDRHPGCHLQDRLHPPFGGAFRRTARNKNDVVCLKLYIRSLCGHNFLEGEWDILQMATGV